MVGPSTSQSAVRLAPSSPSSSPPPSTLAGSAASAGAATMTSRILGLVREQVLAASSAGAATHAKTSNSASEWYAPCSTGCHEPLLPMFPVLHDQGKDSEWRLGNLVIQGLIVINPGVTWNKFAELGGALRARTAASPARSNSRLPTR